MCKCKTEIRNIVVLVVIVRTENAHQKAHLLKLTLVHMFLTRNSTSFNQEHGLQCYLCQFLCPIITMCRHLCSSVCTWNRIMTNYCRCLLNHAVIVLFVNHNVLSDFKKVIELITTFKMASVEDHWKRLKTWSGKNFSMEITHRHNRHSQKKVNCY